MSPRLFGTLHVDTRAGRRSCHDPPSRWTRGRRRSTMRLNAGGRRTAPVGRLSTTLPGRRGKRPPCGPPAFGPRNRGNCPAAHSWASSSIAMKRAGGRGSSRFVKRWPRDDPPVPTMGPLPACGGDLLGGPPGCPLRQPPARHGSRRPAGPRPARRVRRRPRSVIDRIRPGRGRAPPQPKSRLRAAFFMPVRLSLSFPLRRCTATRRRPVLCREQPHSVVFLQHSP